MTDCLNKYSACWYEHLSIPLRSQERSAMNSDFNSHLSSPLVHLLLCGYRDSSWTHCHVADPSRVNSSLLVNVYSQRRTIAAVTAIIGHYIWFSSCWFNMVECRKRYPRRGYAPFEMHFSCPRNHPCYIHYSFELKRWLNVNEHKRQMWLVSFPFPFLAV